MVSGRLVISLPLRLSDVSLVSAFIPDGTVAIKFRLRFRSSRLTKFSTRGGNWNRPMHAAQNFVMSVRLPIYEGIESRALLLMSSSTRLARFTKVEGSADNLAPIRNFEKSFIRPVVL